MPAALFNTFMNWSQPTTLQGLGTRFVLYEVFHSVISNLGCKHLLGTKPDELPSEASS